MLSNIRYKYFRNAIRKLLIISFFAVVLFDLSFILAASLSDQVSVSAFVEPPAGEKSATLVDFSATQMLYEYSDVNFNIKLKNTGNVYIYPKGTIAISNHKGQEKVKLDINEGKIVIQPNQTQNFVVNWDKSGKFALDKYSAQLEIDYGGKEKISWQIKFWIAPVYTTSITLICLLILYFIFRILPIKFSQELHLGRYVYRRS